MANNTSLVLAWRLPMPKPSCPDTARQWRRSSRHGDICRLDTTTAIPSRHLVAVDRSINRIRCSVTLAPTSPPIAGNKQSRHQAQCAAVLAIGTANPTSCLLQEEYAEWYFRVTKCEHLSKLKAKMKKICHNSGIKKRYFYHTEDTFVNNPEFIDRALPSLDARQSILAAAAPELALAAAVRAIAEWGRPAADITHLVFATSSGAHMPGADLRLASLLGLRPSVQRTMMYLNGCSAASAALRVAKDIAENNHGARVLVACAELSLNLFRAPHEDHLDTVIMQALFGDGAAAVVLGSVTGNDDCHGSERRSGGGDERPLFELVSACQTVLPNSEDAAAGQISQDGVAFRPSPKLPALVRQHVEQCLLDALGLGGSSGGRNWNWNWNELFWAVHPGGRAILDSVEAALALAPEKMAPSRHVLSEYGNMSGASVMFVLDELRRRRDDDLEGGIGVMLGLGPGITVETMLLRAASGLTKAVF